MNSLVESNDIITANCSFVTSYPSLVKFPASENVALYAMLYQDIEVILKNIEKQEMNSIKTTIKDVIEEKLQGYFKNSIQTIVDNLSSQYYSVAALQELNNSKFVIDTVNNILEEKSKIFICSSIYDDVWKTYSALGFIVNGNDYEFKDKKIQVENKENFNEDNSYTIINNKDKKISIRDLGTVKKSNYLDETVYLLKDFKDGQQKPDSGRPISMIIREANKEKNEKMIIYLNCHMPNPSVLKIYNDSGVLNNADSILQINNDNTTKLWIDYCREQLQETIVAMLSDFEFDLSNPVPVGTPWIICGDFNDSLGKLKESLTNDGIKILGQEIKFLFSDNIKTCCPNRNSMNQTENEDVKLVASRYNFNRNFDDLIQLHYNNFTNSTDPTIIDDQRFFNEIVATGKIYKPENLAFYGDFIGICNGTITKSEPISIKSDHIAVGAKLGEFLQKGGRFHRKKLTKMKRPKRKTLKNKRKLTNKRKIK
jgi:hypothetical protein